MQRLLLIPAAIFPYSVCLCLGYGFVSGHFRDQVMTVLMNSSWFVQSWLFSVIFFL